MANTNEPTVFFHDRFNVQNAKSDVTNIGLMPIPRHQVDATTVTASYVIAATDSTGVGLFVVECGRPSNAVAQFTVTS